MLLLALGAIYDLLAYQPGPTSVWRRVISGFGVGLLAVILMSAPWRMQPGLFFDTRSVLLSVTGLFFGPLPTVVAAGVAGLWRWHLGGPGMPMGLATVMVTPAVGLLWRRYRSFGQRLGRWEYYVFGVVTHLALMACALALPAELAHKVWAETALPILLVYPPASALLCLLLERQRQWHDLRNFFGQAMDAVADPVFVKDDRFRWALVNNAVCEMLGHPRSALLGKRADEVFSANEITRTFTAREERVLRDGETISSDEEFRNPLTGARRHLVTRLSRYVDPYGRRFVVGVARDVTELRRQTDALCASLAERQRVEDERVELTRRLLHAQKLESLGVLAGGIAHDFNNLLMAVLGNLNMALDDLPPASPARLGVGEAMQAGRRAADLTRQLLAYSGRGNFVLRRLNLSALVEENAHMLRAAIPATVELTLEPGADLPDIEADPGQAQQVVMNLITNAAEAMEGRPGRITLTTGVDTYGVAELARSRLEEKPSPGRYVWLEVEDNGCGMDEATQERVFEPFFTTKFTGRGLGMSAVLGIARAHRGALLLTSAPGRGTTVRALFPPAGRAAPPAAVPAAAPRVAPPALTGLALLAEDEPSVAALCERMLRRLGLEVVCAADGEEALARFRERPADFRLAILDMTMPRLDGLAVFRLLREIRSDLPVILASGFDERDVRARLPVDGINGFLHKPYEMNALRSVLEQALAAPPAGA